MKFDLLGSIVVSVALCASLTCAQSALAAPSCKADVQKFCGQVQAGGGRIAECLKQNEAQLSDGCKERIKMVAERLKEVKQACADDVQQFCASVNPGGGRIAQCLKGHKDKVSAECKAEIAQLREKH
jgi:Cysteine rich repeat